MKDNPTNVYEDWAATHPLERIVKDIDTAANWLVEEMAAAGVNMKVGLVGFSLGGGAIFEVLARDDGRRFMTAACFYPTNFDSTIATKIHVPLLFVCGDNDDKCSPDMLESIATQMRNAKTLLYSGRGQGFAHRPKSLEEDGDAENAFLAMKSWLHEKLVAV